MADGLNHVERATLHVWADGKAILVIDEGELTNEHAWELVKQMKEANTDPKLLVWNFPVEVVEHAGPIDFVGAGSPAGVPDA